MCVCSFNYPACNAHAPYCHLWPVRFHNIFLHYLKNGRIKKQKIEHKMCVFDLLYKFCLKHFSFQEDLSEIWSEKYVGLHAKYTLFLSFFNATLIFLTDFLKMLKYTIAWKSVQWELTCLMRTDRQTWRNTQRRQRKKQILWFMIHTLIENI
jgi:hypothetical protein